MPCKKVSVSFMNVNFFQGSALESDSNFCTKNLTIGVGRKLTSLIISKRDSICEMQRAKFVELSNPAKLGVFQAMLFKWIFYWQRSIIFLTIEPMLFTKSNPFLVQLEPSEVNGQDEIKHVHFDFFSKKQLSFQCSKSFSTITIKNARFDSDACYV